MENKDTGGAVEGLILSGEEVFEFEDKHFEIYAVPFYQDLPSIEDKKVMKRKLFVPVRLSDGTTADWIANKTSQKILTAKCGRGLGTWKGYKGEFVIKNQTVGKDDKKVIYVKE